MQATAYAPPPALPKRHALRAEPLLFAVVLVLQTLGIHNTLATAAGKLETAQAPAPQLAAVR